MQPVGPKPSVFGRIFGSSTKKEKFSPELPKGAKKVPSPSSSPEEKKKNHKIPAYSTGTPAHASKVDQTASRSKLTTNMTKAQFREEIEAGLLYYQLQDEIEEERREIQKMHVEFFSEQIGKFAINEQSLTPFYLPGVKYHEEVHKNLRWLIEQGHKLRSVWAKGVEANSSAENILKKDTKEYINHAKKIDRVVELFCIVKNCYDIKGYLKKEDLENNRALKDIALEANAIFSEGKALRATVSNDDLETTQKLEALGQRGQVVKMNFQTLMPGYTVSF